MRFGINGTYGTHTKTTSFGMQMANRADRRKGNVANTEAFRAAFVQSELVMRQALSIRIQKVIDKTDNADVVSGLQIAQKIVTGEVE